MSSAWPAHGRRWSAEELSVDAATAVAEFRGRRLGEPLKRYLDAFDASKEGNAELIVRLRDVLSVEGADQNVLLEIVAAQVSSGRGARSSFMAGSS